MVKKGFHASLLFGLIVGMCTLIVATASNYSYPLVLAFCVCVCVFVLSWAIIFSVALLYTVIEVYPKKLDRIADEIKYLNRRNNEDVSADE